MRLTAFQAKLPRSAPAQAMGRVSEGSKGAGEGEREQTTN